MQSSSARYGARAAINKFWLLAHTRAVARLSARTHGKYTRARARALHVYTLRSFVGSALRNAESSRNVFMTCRDTVIGSSGRREYDYY